MTYIGKVSGGKVILPPEANFSEGTEVRVQRVLGKHEKSPEGSVATDGGNAERPTLAEWMGDLIGSGDGPSDLAENHDYYAHGAPKGIDRE